MLRTVLLNILRVKQRCFDKRTPDEHDGLNYVLELLNSFIYRARTPHGNNC